MAINLEQASHLTDAQARNLIIKALRQARQAFRTADTQGEKFEREIDRLIKRKTRINSRSFVTLVDRYKAYLLWVENVQKFLTEALNGAAIF